MLIFLRVIAEEVLELTLQADVDGLMGSGRYKPGAAVRRL